MMDANLIEWSYMQNQNEINDQMRAILIDWLIDIHSKFLFKPETLFLTVGIIDKYLSINRIVRANFQLLGVSAMLIACKQEEIFTLHIKDIVNITDKAYTREEVLNMEQEILKSLQFRILTPTSYRFFELISYFFKFNMREFFFGRYLLEIYLIDFSMTKFSASIIACTAAYITMKFFKFSNYQLIYSSFFCSGTDALYIKECAREICLLLDYSDDSSLTAAKRKFSKKEFSEVSKISF
jgi:cyclin B